MGSDLTHMVFANNGAYSNVNDLAEQEFYL